MRKKPEKWWHITHVSNFIGPQAVSLVAEPLRLLEGRSFINELHVHVQHTSQLIDDLQT